ncbi:hypothetical protein A9267_10070 [Shewanella sp. UCD-FRSSP16_17]|uniref:hypothetical protein n=1 Tax=Shewanella sp. UCD-FRSSP16_17 TaxID=1853256 RepID=UPI0007EED72A|nr:hypothetical protein [Shewanella sp. UCD-FRSSP16_17]OBT08063.1 hypothetical protein A9267_10070 [Shewanella sp. UCD-FRSSP16_17]
MLITDCIPTVKSLIEQGAISVSGHDELIEKFSEFISLKGFHFDTSKIKFGPNLTHLEDEIYLDLFKKNQKDRDSYEVLYSLDFSDRISLTAHCHSEQGKSLHLLFTAENTPALDKNALFEALYQLLDNSQYFLVCQKCNQLVDSKLIDIRTEPVCAVGSCSKTFKQVFDVSKIDRITSSRYDEIRVAVFDDEIVIFNAVTFWPHPHESFPGLDIKETLPLSSTPAEVRALKAEIEAEQKFPADCFYCKEEVSEGKGMELSDFINKETNEVICYGCATEHHNVIY